MSLFTIGFASGIIFELKLFLKLLCYNSLIIGVEDRMSVIWEKGVVSIADKLFMKEDKRF